MWSSDLFADKVKIEDDIVEHLRDAVGTTPTGISQSRRQGQGVGGGLARARTARRNSRGQFLPSGGNADSPPSAPGRARAPSPKEILDAIGADYHQRRGSAGSSASTPLDDMRAKYLGTAKRRRTDGLEDYKKAATDIYNASRSAGSSKDREIETSATYGSGGATSARKAKRVLERPTNRNRQSDDGWKQLARDGRGGDQPSKFRPYVDEYKPSGRDNRGDYYRSSDDHYKRDSHRGHDLPLAGYREPEEPEEPRERAGGSQGGFRPAPHYSDSNASSFNQPSSNRYDAPQDHQEHARHGRLEVQTHSQNYPGYEHDRSFPRGSEPLSSKLTSGIFGARPPSVASGSGVADHRYSNFTPSSNAAGHQRNELVDGSAGQEKRSYPSSNSRNRHEQAEKEFEEDFIEKFGKPTRMSDRRKSAVPKPDIEGLSESSGPSSEDDEARSTFEGRDEDGEDIEEDQGDTEQIDLDITESAGSRGTIGTPRKLHRRGDGRDWRGNWAKSKAILSAGTKRHQAILGYVERRQARTRDGQDRVDGDTFYQVLLKLLEKELPAKELVQRLNNVIIDRILELFEDPSKGARQPRKLMVVDMRECLSNIENWDAFNTFQPRSMHPKTLKKCGLKFDLSGLLDRGNAQVTEFPQFDDELKGGNDGNVKIKTEKEGRTGSADHAGSLRVAGSSNFNSQEASAQAGHLLGDANTFRNSTPGPHSRNIHAAAASNGGDRQHAVPRDHSSHERHDLTSLDGTVDRGVTSGHREENRVAGYAIQQARGSNDAYPTQAGGRHEQQFRPLHDNYGSQDILSNQTTTSAPSLPMQAKVHPVIGTQIRGLNSLQPVATGRRPAMATWGIPSTPPPNNDGNSKPMATANDTTFSGTQGSRQEQETSYQHQSITTAHRIPKQANLNTSRMQPSNNQSHSATQMPDSGCGNADFNAHVHTPLVHRTSNEALHTNSAPNHAIPRTSIQQNDPQANVATQGLAESQISAILGHGHPGTATSSSMFKVANTPNGAQPMSLAQQNISNASQLVNILEMQQQRQPQATQQKTSNIGQSANVIVEQSLPNEGDDVEMEDAEMLELQKVQEETAKKIAAILARKRKHAAVEE